MRPTTRKLLDRSFSGLGLASITLMAASLVIILAPIFVRGGGAVFFRGTVEFRRLQLERFGRGDAEGVEAEIKLAEAARLPVFGALDRFDAELATMDFAARRELAAELDEVKAGVAELLGPAAGEKRPVLPRDQYGQTRWDRALVKRDLILYREDYDYSDPTRMGVPVLVPRRLEFAGTALETLFDYVADDAALAAMLRPRGTCYWRFLFDEPVDAHMFGGIWPEVLGTLYLTAGAMLFALPLGVVSAIFLAEYAGEAKAVGLLRICISTLAGVPSIVFGLFGLAFFINTVGVSSSKSVLAGSLTLAVLILPTLIRASEEAIKSVPRTYKEAALSVGATKWRTIVTVVLPAALPGILTGIVISMGRAAGETAPIIFTAAVSVGKPLRVWETLTQPTPALPWNIYNLCTEHEAVDEIRHVQYGMVLTLVLLVLGLNLFGIILRARVSRKLRG